MNYYQTPATVSELPESSRAAFVRRTYGHLAGAVAAFVVLEAALITSGAGKALASLMLGGRWSWLIVLGAFMLVSSLASNWAASATRKSTQYLGLSLYVTAEAIIFAPLIMMALRVDPNILTKATLITAGLFAGLSWIAYATRHDFSFLGGFLRMAGMIALGTILASILFGFSLGTIFCVLMVALVGGSIIYQTSNVLHHYHTDQHVSAALALFASFATLLWYVIQIVMDRD